jgi:hypothetical protein
MDKMPLGKFPRFPGLEREVGTSMNLNRLLRPHVTSESNPLAEAASTSPPSSYSSSSSSSSTNYFPKFSKEQKSSFCIESLLRTEAKTDRDR